MYILLAEAKTGTTALEKNLSLACKIGHVTSSRCTFFTAHAQEKLLLVFPQRHSQENLCMGYDIFVQCEDVSPLNNQKLVRRGSVRLPGRGRDAGKESEMQRIASQTRKKWDVQHGGEVRSHVAKRGLIFTG